MDSKVRDCGLMKSRMIKISSVHLRQQDWAHKAISKGLEAVEVLRTMSLNFCPHVFFPSIQVLALQILEELKEDRGDASVYLAGTREPTMADACLIPQLYNARRSGMCDEVFAGQCYSHFLRYDVDLATTCPHLLEVRDGERGRRVSADDGEDSVT